MKYKLYERDRNSHYQDFVGLFMYHDIFGSYTYIDEEQALAIKLKYPNAHMFPAKDYDFRKDNILPSTK